MKKIFISIITIISITLFCFFGGNTAKVSAAEGDSYYTKTGLGYSINAVKSGYIDVSEIRTGSPIFNSNWLSNQIANIIPDNINYSTSAYYTSSSFKDISSDINSSYGYEQSVGGGYSIFTANAQSGFKVTSTYTYIDHMGQYYYALLANFDRYAYTLPNYSSNLTAYKNNLHSDYLINLDRLFSNSNAISAGEFFDMYGTHVIAKGIYGGKFEAYYSALSNKIDFSGSIGANITNSLNAGISGLVEAGISANYSLNSVIGGSSDLCMDSFRANSWGGNPLSVTSVSNLNQVYSTWLNSINTNPTLIRTSSDGLIPLWNLLPPKYDSLFYKLKMRVLFNQYANSYNNTVNQQYDYIYPETYDMSSYKSVRDSFVYKINDSGRFSHNKYDSINLETFSNHSYSLLKTAGYKTIDVNIKIQVRELNRGYQYIGLYKSTDKNDIGKIGEDYEFEYMGTDFCDEWGYITFSFIGVPIDEFADTKTLVLRYGASGSGADDWENRYLSVKLVYKK